MPPCADLGVTALIELPPAGTLTGIAKRELPGVERSRSRRPDDLDAARALVDQDRARRAGRAHPGLAGGDRAGRRHLHPPGGRRRGHPGVAPAASSGAVRTKKEDLQVSAGYDGVLVEWLLQDGDLVDPG